MNNFVIIFMKTADKGHGTPSAGRLSQGHESLLRFSSWFYMEDHFWTTDHSAIVSILRYHSQPWRGRVHYRDLLHRDFPIFKDVILDLALRHLVDGRHIYSSTYSLRIKITSWAADVAVNRYPIV
jgi:hypothetical protein